MLYLLAFILGVLARHFWPCRQTPVTVNKRAVTGTGGLPSGLPSGATRTRDDDVAGDGDPGFEFELKG